MNELWLCLSNSCSVASKLLNKQIVVIIFHYYPINICRIHLSFKADFGNLCPLSPFSLIIFISVARGLLIVLKFLETAFGFIDFFYYFSLSYFIDILIFLPILFPVFPLLWIWFAFLSLTSQDRKLQYWLQIFLLFSYKHFKLHNAEYCFRGIPTKFDMFIFIQSKIL